MAEMADISLYASCTRPLLQKVKEKSVSYRSISAKVGGRKHVQDHMSCAKAAKTTQSATRTSCKVCIPRPSGVFCRTP